MSNENQPQGVSIRVNIDANLFYNIIALVLGAGTVIGIFTVLQWLGQAISAIMPFVLGTTLFATVVGGFFYLLSAQKILRQTPKLRISFSEGYAALTIFISMGLFAMACMHAFQADGLALGIWTQGVTAVALSAIFFGVGKFFVSSWNEGGNKSS